MNHYIYIFCALVKKQTHFYLTIIYNIDHIQLTLNIDTHGLGVPSLLAIVIVVLCCTYVSTTTGSVYAS